MQLFNRHVSSRTLTVFGFETLLICGSILIVVRGMHGSFETAVGAPWKMLLVAALCELCLYYNDVYDLTVVRSKGDLLVRVLRAASSAAIVLALLSLVLPSLVISHDISMISLSFLLIAIPAWRIAFDGLTYAPQLEERLLILGTGNVAGIVAREIQSQRNFPYRIVGFLDDPPRDDHESAALTRPVLGVTADLPRLIGEHNINRIVVCLADRRGHLPIQELLHAKIAAVRVEDAATTYERITGKLLTEEMKPSWLIFSDGFRASRPTRFVKRMLDLAFAAVGLVVGAPLMLLTAIAIRIESEGPILFGQERVGASGRVFTMFKFRSMRADAENGTPVWARDHDDRVTAVGRFIRRTRLDELPQLWNVLRGDMSFVGPRPERPYFVQQLAETIPFYMERHAVRPGVTGWAQVKYRYGASIEDAMEKLRYDLYYVKHLGIGFDLTIVIDTVKVILLGKGAK